MRGREKADAFDEIDADYEGDEDDFRCALAESAGSRIGGASICPNADQCADYCVTMFSDLTKMVTMQNLFHDGGFSFTGVTQAVMEQMEK